MSIWNKILVGVICFVCLGYFYMAARTLKTHKYWRELAQKFERRIADVQQQNDRLTESEPGQVEFAQMGIRQRRIELNKLLLDRGRVWFKADPKVRVSQEDGSVAVTVTIDNPDPSGIAENTILYAFEEADVQNKGHYLGEFKVTKTDPKQKTVVLVPTQLLGPRQLAQLTKAQRPWELHEIMPRDSHDIFASVSDQQKSAMLPKESLPEYLGENQGKSERSLRDYQVLFNYQNLHRVLKTDQIDLTTRDLALVQDALAQAQQQEEAAKQDVALAKEEVKKFARQRDAVAAYLAKVRADVEAAQAALKQLIENNKAMAGQIAKLQLDAWQQIDQRSRAMARSGTGG
jgi:hypothetical protein